MGASCRGPDWSETTPAHSPWAKLAPNAPFPGTRGRRLFARCGRRPGRDVHRQFDERLRRRSVQCRALFAARGDLRGERGGGDGHDPFRDRGGAEDDPAGLGAADDHGSGDHRRDDAAGLRRNADHRDRWIECGPRVERAADLGGRVDGDGPGDQPFRRGVSGDQRARDPARDGRRKHDPGQLHRNQLRRQRRAAERGRRRADLGLDEQSGRTHEPLAAFESAFGQLDVRRANHGRGLRREHGRRQPDGHERGRDRRGPELGRRGRPSTPGRATPWGPDSRATRSFRGTAATAS